MSHSPLETSSHHSTPLDRWVLPSVALAAWISGTIGSAQYELHHAGHVDYVSAAYHGIQLLIAHSPHLEAPIPFALQLGRWLGAVTLVLGAAKFLLRVFRTDLQTLLARWRKGHVIICGLGERGLRLAREARAAGLHPVAIECAEQLPAVQEARDLGIPVIIGDACRPEVLARAGAARATDLFAVSGDDETNLGAVLVLEKLRLDTGATKPAQGWLFLQDPDARTDLQLRPLFPRRDRLYHINPRALDLEAVSARRAFATLPLRHLRFSRAEPKRPLLVVVGLGSCGMAIIRQAALLAHFPGSGKLQILAVDSFADDALGTLRRAQPNIDLVADFELINGSFDDPAILTRVAQTCTTAHADGRLLAAAFCDNGGNIANTRHALRLAEATASTDFPVPVFLSCRAGMAQLLATAAPSSALAARLSPFGMDEDIRDFATLRDEVQDRLAQQFHQLYLEERTLAREKNPDLPRRPAELPWLELPETFRDATRAQADHLRFKLFTVGLQIVPATPASAGSAAPAAPAAGFTETQIKELSEVEHARWCAERWLAGWTYAKPRNEAARQHNLLVSWAKLAPAERHIDQHLMENAFAALRRAGLTTAPLQLSK